MTLPLLLYFRRCPCFSRSSALARALPQKQKRPGNSAAAFNSKFSLSTKLPWLLALEISLSTISLLPLASTHALAVRSTNLVAEPRAHAHPLASLGPPPAQHCRAALCLHPAPEPVYLAPPPPVWLKCPLRHRLSSCSLISFVPGVQLPRKFHRAPSLTPCSSAPKRPARQSFILPDCPLAPKSSVHTLVLNFPPCPLPAFSRSHPSPLCPPQRTPSHLAILDLRGFSSAVSFLHFRNQKLAALSLCSNPLSTSRPLYNATASGRTSYSIATLCAPQNSVVPQKSTLLRRTFSYLPSTFHCAWCNLSTKKYLPQSTIQQRVFLCYYHPRSQKVFCRTFHGAQHNDHADLT